MPLACGVPPAGSQIFSTLITPTATLSAVGDSTTLTDTVSL